MAEKPQPAAPRGIPGAPISATVKRGEMGEGDQNRHPQGPPNQKGGLRGTRRSYCPGEGLVLTPNPSRGKSYSLYQEPNGHHYRQNLLSIEMGGCWPRSTLQLGPVVYKILGLWRGQPSMELWSAHTRWPDWGWGPLDLDIQPVAQPGSRL